MNYNDYYTKKSKLYNEIRLDAPENFENTIKLFMKHIGPGPKKVLDIGCGTGKYGERLKKEGYSIIGIDKSPSQLVEAKSVIDVMLANATDIPFECEVFDACMMIMMIHQLSAEERVLAIKEAYRVLKKGGYLFIKTASEDDLKRRVMDLYFPKVLDIDLKRYPAMNDLSNELSCFEEVVIERLDLKIEFEKDILLDRLSQRCSTNLSLISDEDLQIGLTKLADDYRDCKKIVVNSCNTILIAKK